jgi:hypothetical protein
MRGFGPVFAGLSGLWLTGRMLARSAAPVPRAAARLAELRRAAAAHIGPAMQAIRGDAAEEALDYSKLVRSDTVEATPMPQSAA